MVICHIWDADYPWDVRVEKVCQSLQTKHKVHLVCRNEKRSPRRELLQGISIHRLPALPRWLGPCHTAAGVPLFFNPTWLGAIWSTVRRVRADLILVRDLPLAPAALMAGRWFGIPVLIDLAENYPAMLEDQRHFSPRGVLGSALRHPKLASALERWVLKRVDHIIVVIEESRDRLISMGIDPSHITTVTNTPRLEQWARVNPQLAPRGDSVHLVYLGNLDGSRGLDTAIEALALLRDRGRYVKLTIIGTGPNIGQNRELAKALAVTDRVAITGRLPFTQVEKIMAQANAGLIPHYRTPAWNTTIPNKLYDFMAMGKPVVVSDALPTARIVNEVQCGIVFRERDPQHLAAAIEALGDEARRRELGERGRRAFETRYNWAVDERPLFEALDRTMRARGGQQ
jgi:glycosyltransferase involved in cell wall biosynthesis